MIPAKANNVNYYILGYPQDVQALLKQIRMTIKQSAPQAEESISYGMPAYKLNGSPLVYFAAYKNHIGFYATPAGHSKFEKDLSKYKQGKGSVQFPLNDVPLDLIKRMVEFKVSENSRKKLVKIKTG